MHTLDQLHMGGVLADDMGLGKTIQSITYMLWLREDYVRRNKQGRKKVVIPPVLIVCPKSVLDVWASETEKFAPGVRVMVIRNKEQVVTSGSTVYPRGLIMGSIVDAGFAETGIAKFALLEPAAAIDSLEQIFIITNYNAG